MKVNQKAFMNRLTLKNPLMTEKEKENIYQNFIYNKEFKKTKEQKEAIIIKKHEDAIRYKFNLKIKKSSQLILEEEKQNNFQKYKENYLKIKERRQKYKDLNFSKRDIINYNRIRNKNLNSLLNLEMTEEDLLTLF